MVKLSKINVQGKEVAIIFHNEENYVCLTDLCKGFDGNGGLIEKWLSTKNTLEYLTIWETLNNKDFNSPEIGGVMKSAGSNNFYMSVKKWIELTNAKGIIAKSGRYGGTYAHKDIALKFGSYLSPAFELYINKEFQRLKEVEQNTYNIEWNIKRVLSKINYNLHTNAVEKHIIPKSTYPKDKQWIEYADEADLLNTSLFGCTAKEWRVANPEHAKNNLNIRDFASINELTVIANMESMNSEMIRLGGDKKSRFILLFNMAKDQLSQLKHIDLIKSVRRQHETTYIEAQEKTGEELDELTSKSILDKNKDALSNFNKKSK